MNTYPGKRTLDILVSGAACLAIAPVMAGVTVATWLEDRGSPLFRQTRVGSHRRPFTIIKFRSMRNQRVTHTGQWLRQTGIDELPQFLNVLRGEMSVVGPRPLTESDIDRLSWGDSGHDWRFEANPGITGLSQLYAGRGARASERLDRLYLKRQSVVLDLQLIAATFVVNIVGKRQLRRWLRTT